MTGRKWERVSRTKPCPVCGKPDWCVHVEGGTICPRTPEGSVRDLGDAGYLHLDGTATARRRPRTWPLREMHPDVGPIARECFNAADAPIHRERLSRLLDVDAGALERLGVGWNAERSAWTFPMSDGCGRIVGIQQRFRGTGDKRLMIMKGHRSGLFEPIGMPDRSLGGVDLVICEGASDTAAALSLGITAIGRLSCSAIQRETVERVRRLSPRSVIVVADNDAPGLEGAEKLLCALDGIAQTELRRPPDGIKDLRAWKQAGATAGDITKGAA
jgi:hypothetical protein